MNELSNYISGLSPEEMDRLFENLSATESPAATLRARPRDEALPLSYAQQRLWFWEQLKPGTNTYNLHTTIRMEGALRADLLEQGLRLVIARHEILRTIFPIRNGGPIQHISGNVDFSLAIENLEALTEWERDSEVARIISSEARTSFDVQRGPLFRARLLRLREHCQLLALTMHHIISDGWSWRILIQELMDSYSALLAGRSPSLPPLPIQYADYAAWQREWLDENRIEALQGIAKRRLDGAPRLLALPVDRPRPPVQSFRGASEPFFISPDLSIALRQIGAAKRASLFMLLAAAFEVFLSRYTGQSNFLLGTPVSTRNQVEIESLVGVFVNTLVLRADTSGNPTFTEFLDRVREDVLEAHTLQDLPFELLVDRLQPERVLSHTPLIQAMFVLQDLAIDGLEVAGLKLSAFGAESGTTKFDLTLTLTESTNGLSGFVEYNTDIFNAEPLRRMLGNFQVLLRGIAENPDRPLSELPLLDEDELVNVGWNTPAPLARPEGASACLHQLFELRAEAAPDAIAIVDETGQHTYRALNERASQIAALLQNAGAIPESIVAICHGRSVEMIASLLGVLKAGAAYAPLDPINPPDRLLHILNDTKAPILITETRLLSKVAGYPGRILCTDNITEDLTAISSEYASPAVCPGNAAYVIYTSGSTGLPKGVVISHSNVTRLFEQTQRWFQFDERDVWTLFHSYAFDFSVWEIWGALLFGGRLVITPYILSRSPEAFHRFVSQQQVTVLNQTPSAFHQYTAVHFEPGREHDRSASSLRLVIFGGETLDYHSLKDWFEIDREHSPRLVNMYGITETTVHVTYRQITASDLETKGSSRIGRAIPDLRVIVANEYLKPSPMLVPGELYVAGEGLARGYLNRPDLTAERFLPSPCPANPGERVYKSGDLARVVVNEDLEYLGRSDRQVKLRGFRIELGEIESVLLREPGVIAAVVMSQTAPSGDPRLLAYVAAASDSGITRGGLRDRLQQKLPEYMIPSVIRVLDVLPMTVNGKVDRAALERLQPESAVPESAPEPPRNTIEEVLAQIWAQGLQLDRVGIHDNFFALGGDSILSVRLAALARERGVRFSIEQLFQHQTIAELSRVIRLEEPLTADNIQTDPFSLISAADRAALPPEIEDAYPLTVSQAGLLYQMELNPSAPIYHNVDSLRFRVDRFDKPLLQRAVDQLVAAHPIMRTSFELSRYSEPIQCVHRSAPLPIVFEDLRTLSPYEQEAVLRRLVEAEMTRRFDLSTPPLLRFHVHLLSDQIVQFTQTESHPIHDGWSMNSMLVELFARYQALLERKEYTEKSAVGSFRDYVALERQALQSDASLRFWESKLGDWTAPDIPYRWSDESEEEEPVQFVPLPQALWDDLNQLAKQAAVPIKSVFLAAHIKALSVFCATRDVLTGLITHGRPEDIGGENLRGFFLNTIPARLKLSSGAWTDLIQETLRIELEAMPHKRYPLGELQKRYGRQALIETAFNFINFHVLDKLPHTGAELLEITHSVNRTHFTLSATFSMNTRYWGKYFPDAAMVILLQYDPAKLSQDVVARLGAVYLEILTEMATAPSRSHAERSFLIDAEQQRLTAQWNDTYTDYPRELCIHQLFEELARRQPDSIAASYSSKQISYEMLDRESNRLARRLQALGCGPETRVGVCLHRSIEMVMAAMAIWKAGAVYTPLDPFYPRERIEYLTANAQLRILLTEKKLAGLFEGTVETRLCLDEPTPSAENLPAPTIICSDNSAYLIFTSGSTGKPKGVLISHRSLCNLARAQEASFRVGRGDRVLQFSSSSFDASIFEIVMALCSGAELCLSSKEAILPGSSLADLIRRNQISVATLPPSALLVTPHQDLDCLGIITSAGEECPAEVVARWAPGRTFFNLYGPTEAAIWSTEALCQGQDRKITIGHPIANVRIHILDEDLHAVPLAVASHLHIAGEGLARGYLDMPDLTADKFIPNPFSEKGERIYRTGDRARYLPDGRIDFLGRLDQQLKFHGHRIEPGEIESALLEHPSVREAAVLVHREAGAESNLVAYVSLREPMYSSSLRTYLRGKLPENLVPTAFVVMKELPKTPNGKLDRRTLPAPERTRPSLEAVYIEPKSDAEQKIAAIWRDILRLERVGTEDNFFDLGGHSIRMTQVHGRLQEVFQTSIPLVDLFRYPTIAALAKRLSEPSKAYSVEASLERAEMRKELMERKQRLRNRI